MKYIKIILLIFVVYYFHGNRRCPTCNAIEKYTRETLENNYLDKINNEELKWEIVNIEASEKQHFINDFQLRSSGPVIVQYKDGNIVKWKSLDKVWQLVRDKNEFTIYIDEEIEGSLNERNYSSANNLFMAWHLDINQSLSACNQYRRNFFYRQKS